MRAMIGSTGGHLVDGAPPDDDRPFAVWGQDWLALRILPRAIAEQRPFWHVDNGYVFPAGGRIRGFYRLTYRGLAATFLPEAAPERADRLRLTMKPWRTDGRHVLIALPGEMYGRAAGLDMREWIRTIEAEVRRHTDRPIVVRPKSMMRSPLQDQLENCWALVTHSSNVAVEAVLGGVPVFVAPSSPCAPVGNLDLADLEEPATPDRAAWWRSLCCQQFTLEEMARGVARDHMRAIAHNIDGG